MLMGRPMIAVGSAAGRRGGAGPEALGGGGWLAAMSPGGVLVVGGAGLQAAVQDAGQAAGDAAQRVGVVDLACSQFVVVGPRAWRCADRRERLVVHRVD